MKRVALVGSRKLSEEGFEQYAEAFRRASIAFAKAGFIFRSGNAEGADEIAQTAYTELLEAGIVSPSQFEVFLPHPKFRNYARGFEYCTYVEVCAKAKDIARDVHPNPRYIEPYIHLHARNVYQVLGTDLKTPVDIMVCFTVNGRIEGGTATAINIALDNGIPVINIGRGLIQDRIQEIISYLESVK